jgi:hypothetical protein
MYTSEFTCDSGAPAVCGNHSKSTDVSVSAGQSSQLGQADSDYQQAKRRQLWLASPERESVLRLARTLSVASVACLLAVAVGSVFFFTDGSNTVLYGPSFEEARWAFVLRSVALALATFFLFGGYIVAVFKTSKRRVFRERLLVEDAESNLRDAESAVHAEFRDHGSSLELASLWNLTHARLDYYHQIATRQAQASFRNSQVATTAGFTVVILAVLASLLAGSLPVSIVAAVLGTTGVALSGFVSRTFLKAQEVASAQLKGYFLQPLEFSRYLVAERLLGTLSESDKSKGILMLVSGISAGPNCQQETHPARTTHDQERPQ